MDVTNYVFKYWKILLIQTLWREAEYKLIRNWCLYFPVIWIQDTLRYICLNVHCFKRTIKQILSEYDRH